MIVFTTFKIGRDNIIETKNGGKKMKKALSLLLALLIVPAFLFAGGSTESATVTEGAKSGGVTEITLLSNSVKPHDTAIPKMVEAFEAQNPDVKVKIEMLPTKNLLEVVEVKLGSGEKTPDVLYVDAPMVTAYAVKNYLMPLDEYFTPEEMDQYVEVCKAYGTVDGKFYAAPFVNSSQVLYYNTRMFQEAGIEPLSKDPNERLTWEELVEIAKKLTIDSDNDGNPEVFGLGIAQVSRPYQILSMPESKGGDAIGEGGLTVDGVFTSDAWISAGEFYQKLFNEYKVCPKGVSASDMLAYFVSEKVAMLIGPDYNHLAYSQNKDLTWDYAPYPYFEGGKVATPTGSWSLGVNKASKNVEASVRLIKFLTLYPTCIDWFEMDGHLPSNKNTLKYIEENEKYTKWPFDIFSLLKYESDNTAVARPLSVGYLEYESMLTSAFEDIRNGADVRSTFEQTEAKLNRTLQKYR